MKMAIFYAKLINQKIYKHQTVFSALFDKQNKENQILDETELFIKLNIKYNLRETDIDNVDINSP